MSERALHFFSLIAECSGVFLKHFSWEAASEAAL